MANFGRFEMNPKKLWDCDCCFEISTCKTIDRNGGYCPSCGGENFSSVNDSVPTFAEKEAEEKRQVPGTEFRWGKLIAKEQV